MVTENLSKNETVYDWVQIAKGIGILLVVVGHFYPETAPKYWCILRDLIYSFHMPLFFVLSGFLYDYKKYNYNLLIKNKVRRLIYPFFSIAFIFLIIKYMAGLFLHLEHPVQIEKISALFVDPIRSYMPLLWYVYALFFIFLIYPLIRKIIGRNIVLLLLFIFLNILIGNNFPVLGSSLANIPYFIIGVILRENSELLDKIFSTNWIIKCVALLLFALLFQVAQIIKIEGRLNYLLIFVLGISGVMCVINISQMMVAKMKIGLIRVLFLGTGFYSMTIYLFHPLFESAVRIVFNQVFVDHYVVFEFVAFTAVAAGLVFPLLLEKIVLRRIRFTRRYLLGLK